MVHPTPPVHGAPLRRARPDLLLAKLRFALQSILILLICGPPKRNGLYVDQRRRALQVVAPIAKSAAVHSTSCVAVMPALAARRVWIGLQDMCDGVG
jgi:hypothetical protein